MNKKRLKKNSSKKIKNVKQKCELVYFGEDTKFTKANSIDYWQKKSPFERFKATVAMAEEVAEMKGIKNVERFLRTVALLKRI